MAEKVVAVVLAVRSAPVYGDVVVARPLLQLEENQGEVAFPSLSHLSIQR